MPLYVALAEDALFAAYVLAGMSCTGLHKMFGIDKPTVKKAMRLARSRHYGTSDILG